MVDDRLIQRARWALDVEQSFNAAGTVLVENGVEPEDAYLALKAAEILDKHFGERQ